MFLIILLSIWGEKGRVSMCTHTAHQALEKSEKNAKFRLFSCDTCALWVYILGRCASPQRRSDPTYIIFQWQLLTPKNKKVMNFWNFAIFWQICFFFSFFSKNKKTTNFQNIIKSSIFNIFWRDRVRWKALGLLETFRNCFCHFVFFLL